MINQFNQAYTALSLKPGEKAVLSFVGGLAGSKVHEKLGSPFRILQMAQGHEEAPDYLNRAMRMIRMTSESAVGPMFLNERLDELLTSKGLSPNDVDQLLIKAAGLLGVVPEEDRLSNLSKISEKYLENQERFVEPVTAGVTCPRCGAFYFV